MQALTLPRRSAAPREFETAAASSAPTDLSLISATLGGDRNAFGELVRRYESRMYLMVHAAVRNPDDASDLTQEIFIKAYAGLKRFNEKASFYTWLYRIAVNTCIDFSRHRSRVPAPLSLSDERLTEFGVEPVDLRAANDPMQALVSKTLRARLDEAMATLPEPFRTAVLLRDVEGLSQKEIAELTDCPVGTVKSRVQRGRQILRTRLAPFVTPAE